MWNFDLKGCVHKHSLKFAKEPMLSGVGGRHDRKIFAFRGQPLN